MSAQLNFAVFIDYDNLAIGIKDALNRSFDYSLVKEWLRARGEIVSQVAYGNWNAHRDFKSVSKGLSQQGVKMEHLETSGTGTKNGADIALSIDAMELVFTQTHIDAYCILSGDSDFVPLVQKLKKYNKRVFVVAEDSFASESLRGNCHEFVSYSDLAGMSVRESGRSFRHGARLTRQGHSSGAARGQSASQRSNAETESAGKPTLDDALRVLLQVLGSIAEIAGRGLSRSDLRAAVREAEPDFEIGKFGLLSFRDLLDHACERGYLEARQEAPGGGVRYFGTRLLERTVDGTPGVPAGDVRRTFGSRRFDGGPSSSGR